MAGRARVARKTEKPYFGSENHKTRAMSGVGQFQRWRTRIVKYLFYSTNRRFACLFFRKADAWPSKLILQLMPKQLIVSIGGIYLKNSKSVLFHPQNCEALESLTKVLSTGFVSIVCFLRLDVLFLLGSVVFVKIQLRVRVDNSCNEIRVLFSDGYLLLIDLFCCIYLLQCVSLTISGGLRSFH